MKTVFGITFVCLFFGTIALSDRGMNKLSQRGLKEFWSCVTNTLLSMVDLPLEAVGSALNETFSGVGEFALCAPMLVNTSSVITGTTLKATIDCILKNGVGTIFTVIKILLPAAGQLVFKNLFQLVFDCLKFLFQ
ncbi:uncharacterized protein LOC116173255 [Photinus pyralis]|uniref:uncharacterized protein LOC116173255 n=1 Tax=Photinus pyralis TaxID=7054 RepID=UPI00126766CC|nr:uncharacterized protein LOC116173255 [Photinus pyralis]